LLYGVTSVMFEGTPDYPDHAVYWRLMEKHKVNVIFSVPTVFKMLERFGIEHAQKHDLSSLRLLFLAGEYVNPEIVKWATEATKGIPVIDHYWLTEAGWPMTSIMAGVGMLPIKPGVANKPVIGWQLAVVDKKGHEVPVDTEGYLVARSPLPPGHITTLWQNKEFYKKDYWQFFPGRTLFLCGDYSTRDVDGYLKIGARVDEVINVAGQRISTREIAHVISTHPSVQEVCVIGAADALKGDEPVGLVVLKPGIEGATPLKMELRNLVRDMVGAIAAPKDIRFVSAIPKNPQGKHLRQVVKAVLDKREITDFNSLHENATEAEIKTAFELLKGELG
ncbi:MAG: AMP-binding protein, partial [Dehalococcoidales bacterium]|nr:AMP-binding protein [Dehalococcoidales bacterium]